jgi:DNA primase
MPNWLGATSSLGTEIKVISLPQGKDPDDVIRESPEQWQRLEDEALPIMEFFFAAVEKLDLTKPEARAEASERLLPLIAEMGDELERELYLRKLSQLIGVSERTLAGRAARLRRTKAERLKGSEPPPIHSGDPLEEYCLCLLLQYPELKGKAGKLSPEHFERSENRELFLAWQENPQEMEKGLDQSLHEHLEALRTKPLPPIEERGRERALNDCIRHLEERWLRARDEFLTRELRPEVIGVNIELLKGWQQKGDDSR